MKKAALVLASLLILSAVLVLVYVELRDGTAKREAISRLEKEPVYQVLARHEPEAHRRVIQEYEKLLEGQVTREQFTNFANGEWNAVTTRRLAHAADAAIVALVADMLATARLLAKQPGDACFRFWFPEISGPPDVARLVDSSAQQRTFEAMAEVIRSAAESPVELPRNDEVAGKLASVVNATFEQFGADAQMIANAADPRVDRAKVCVMTIALYERILAWPPADSAAIVRAMTQVQ